MKKLLFLVLCFIPAIAFANVAKVENRCNAKKHRAHRAEKQEKHADVLKCPHCPGMVYTWICENGHCGPGNNCNDGAPEQRDRE